MCEERLKKLLKELKILFVPSLPSIKILYTLFITSQRAVRAVSLFYLSVSRLTITYAGISLTERIEGIKSGGTAFLYMNYAKFVIKTKRIVENCSAAVV
jgi:hypothetical protein